MSFTSVLKKIGEDVVKGAAIGSEIMGFPFISQMLAAIPGKPGQIVQVAASDFDSMASIISSAEIAGQAFNATGQTGAQKLATAAPQIQAMVMSWAQSSLPGHSNVKDPALLQKACTEITSGFSDAMNSFGA